MSDMELVERWITSISWHPATEDRVKNAVAANVRAFARFADETRASLPATMENRECGVIAIIASGA